MDVREKLVELIQESGACFDCFPVSGYEKNQIEKIASHLIANGVTVQEWISVTERLPTIYDADDDNCVLAIHKATNKRYYHWRSVANNPFDFTYWTRTPHPPYRRGWQA